MGRPDMFLDHLAAFLGLDPMGPEMHLRDLAYEQPRVSQIVVHNIQDRPLLRNQEFFAENGCMELMLMPEPGIRIEPEAILYRAVVNHSVTEDGFHIDPTVDTEIQELTGRLFEPA
jgi:hypothetical protein